MAQDATVILYQGKALADYSGLLHVIPRDHINLCVLQLWQRQALILDLKFDDTVSLIRVFIWNTLRDIVCV